MNTMYEFGGMGSLPTDSCEKDSDLTSLDFSKCSTSSPSFFDSSCNRGDSSAKLTHSGSRYLYPSVSSPSSSVFEFPSLDELDNMGCDLLDGYWDEDQVQSTLNSSGCGAEALNFTIGDSQEVNRVFELKEPPPSNAAPTLTELNMEDSLDSLFSLKPKVPWTRKVSKPATISMPIADESKWKAIRDEHSGLSISPTTWNSVKNSQVLSNTGLFVPKTSELVGSSSKEKQAANDRLRSPSAVKEEQPRVDFANLFGRRSRKQNGAKPGRKPLSNTMGIAKLQGDVKREPLSPIRKCKDEPQKTNKRHTIDINGGFPNKHFHKDVEEENDDGAESHDEGLGSENEEEHHEFNEEEDEDLADDASDISEEIAPVGVAVDPLSQVGCSQVRSRRSEYDDFTPNPEKLLFIGRELQKLNNIIHDMKPTGDPSSCSRNKARREKNKLASRACRLKKKAQHEANKLKMKALKDEYECLSETTNQVKVALQSFRDNPAHVDTKLLCTRLERLVDHALGKPQVAGQTDSFVNLVLDRTAQGEPAGLKLVLEDGKEDDA